MSESDLDSKVLHDHAADQHDDHSNNQHQEETDQQAPSQPTDQSNDQSTDRSSDVPEMHSHSQFINQSDEKSIDNSTDESNNHSIDDSESQLDDNSTDQSIDHSFTQPMTLDHSMVPSTPLKSIRESIEPSSNQSTNSTSEQSGDLITPIRPSDISSSSSRVNDPSTARLRPIPNMSPVTQALNSQLNNLSINQSPSSPSIDHSSNLPPLAQSIPPYLLHTPAKARLNSYLVELVKNSIQITDEFSEMCKAKVAEKQLVIDSLESEIENLKSQLNQMSLNQSMHETMNQSIDESVNQADEKEETVSSSDNQLPIDQSINQSINHNPLNESELNQLLANKDHRIAALQSQLIELRALATNAASKQQQLMRENQSIKQTAKQAISSYRTFNIVTWLLLGISLLLGLAAALHFRDKIIPFIFDQSMDHLSPVGQQAILNSHFFKQSNDRITRELKQECDIELDRMHHSMHHDHHHHDHGHETSIKYEIENCPACEQCSKFDQSISPYPPCLAPSDYELIGGTCINPADQTASFLLSLSKAELIKQLLDERYRLQAIEQTNEIKSIILKKKWNKEKDALMKQIESITHSSQKIEQAIDVQPNQQTITQSNNHSAELSACQSQLAEARTALDQADLQTINQSSKQKEFIDSCNEDKAKLQQKIDQSLTTISESVANQTRLQAELETHQATISQLTNQSINQQTTIDQINQNVEQCQKEKTELAATIEQLTSQVATEPNVDQQAALEQCEREKAEQSLTITQLNNLSFNQTNTIEQLTNELVNQTMQVEQCLTQLNEEISKKTNPPIIDTQFDQLGPLSLDLLACQQERQTYADQSIQQAALIEVLNGQLQGNATAVTQCHQQLESLTHSHNQTMDHNIESLHRCEQLLSERDQTISQNAKSLLEYESQSLSHSTCQSTLNQTIEDLRVCESSLLASQSQRAVAQDQLTDATKELELCQQSSQSTQTSVAPSVPSFDAQPMIDSLLVQIDRAEAQLSDAMLQLAALSKEGNSSNNEALTQPIEAVDYEELARCQSELSRLRESIKQSTNDVSSCHNEVDSLKSRIDVLRQSINRLTEENEIIKQSPVCPTIDDVDQVVGQIVLPTMNQSSPTFWSLFDLSSPSYLPFLPGIPLPVAFAGFSNWPSHMKVVLLFAVICVDLLLFQCLIVTRHRAFFVVLSAIWTAAAAVCVQMQQFFLATLCTANACLAIALLIRPTSALIACSWKCCERRNAKKPTNKQVIKQSNNQLQSNGQLSLPAPPTNQTLSRPQQAITQQTSPALTHYGDQLPPPRMPSRPTSQVPSPIMPSRPMPLQTSPSFPPSMHQSNTASNHPPMPQPSLHLPPGAPLNQQYSQPMMPSSHQQSNPKNSPPLNFSPPAPWDLPAGESSEFSNETNFSLTDSIAATPAFTPLPHPTMPHNQSNMQSVNQFNDHNNLSVDSYNHPSSGSMPMQHMARRGSFPEPTVIKHVEPAVSMRKSPPLESMSFPSELTAYSTNHSQVSSPLPSQPNSRSVSAAQSRRNSIGYAPLLQQAAAAGFTPASSPLPPPPGQQTFSYGSTASMNRRADVGFDDV